MRITFSDGKTADIPFGKDGEKGETGANGKSAYDIAKENGFHGSVSEWLQSLKGKDGNDGAKGENGKDGTSVTIWTGTQSDYNSLDSKDFNTLYLIKG
ncbi:phage upper tail fiber protein [Staphylococcus chromogenes]